MSMRTWAAVAGAALGAVGLKKYLDLARPGRLPCDEEISAYLDRMFETAGMPGLSSQIEEDRLECDGLQLHLDLFLSDPGGPAIVFIPGTSVYALVYAEFMHKMRLGGFNVVGLDPRGHGRSEGTRGAYTVETLLRDARAAVDYAIDRFGERVAIAGSSQGGITALYAAAADERLKAAVCHNIAVLGEPESLEITRWPAFSRLLAPVLPTIAGVAPAMRFPVALYLDLNMEFTKTGMSALEFFKTDPLVVQSITMEALASLSSTPPAVPIEDIKVPVMVIHGENDHLFDTEYIKKIYDRLRCEKEFLLLPGVPHLVMTNSVDEVVTGVSAWLRRYLM